jgi:hypothetical protein
MQNVNFACNLQIELHIDITVVFFLFRFVKTQINLIKLSFFSIISIPQLTWDTYIHTQIVYYKENIKSNLQPIVVRRVQPTLYYLQQQFLPV